MLHMGLLEYFIDNYVMLYELIGLFAILGISTLLSSRMKRLTISIVVLLLLESVIYKLERWTQTLTHLSYFRPFFTATLYTMYPLILMLLILLTETDSFSRRSLVLTIPWLVSIPISTHHNGPVWSAGIPRATIIREAYSPSSRILSSDSTSWYS